MIVIVLLVVMVRFSLLNIGVCMCFLVQVLFSVLVWIILLSWLMILFIMQGFCWLGVCCLLGGIQGCQEVYQQCDYGDCYYVVGLYVGWQVGDVIDVFWQKFDVEYVFDGVEDVFQVEGQGDVVDQVGQCVEDID